MAAPQGLHVIDMGTARARLTQSERFRCRLNNDFRLLLHDPDLPQKLILDARTIARVVPAGDSRHAHESRALRRPMWHGACLI